MFISIQINTSTTIEALESFSKLYLFTSDLVRYNCSIATYLPVGPLVVCVSLDVSIVVITVEPPILWKF